MLYVICNLVTLALCLLKLFAILVHRTEFFNLIIYLQQKFLQSKYDLYEKAAVDTCKRKCNIYICCFAFFALATCFSYIFTALVGKSIDIDLCLYKSVHFIPILEYPEFLKLWGERNRLMTHGHFPHHELWYLLPLLLYHDSVPYLRDGMSEKQWIKNDRCTRYR